MAVKRFISEETYRVFCACHKRILDLSTRYNVLYLYGNGRYADILSEYLQVMGVSVTGHCISGTPSAEENAVSIHDLSPDIRTKAGFIFAVKEEYQQEINASLASNGIVIDILHLPDDYFRICRDYLAFAHRMKRLEEAQDRERTEPLTVYAEIERETEQVDHKRWIILQRQYGMGDAFYLEPIARKLYSMGYAVFISTDYGFIFQNASYVTEVFPFNGVPQWVLDRAFLMDYFNSYERRPFMHILDAYIRQTQELLPGFSLNEEERIPVYDSSLIRERDKKRIRKICVNFEASEWKSRMYPRRETEKILKELSARGYEIYEIGCNEAYYLGVGINCYGFSFPETMKVMSEMDLFFGLDNGLMHFAQSIHLPVFVLFGCTCPEYRIIDWKNARVMWKNAKELVCAGCHHRVRIPQNYTYCAREGHPCMDWTAEEVLDVFDTLTYDKRPVLTEEDRVPISWNEKEWRTI